MDERRMRRSGATFGVTLILDMFRVDGVLYVDRERGRFQEDWAELLHGRREYVPVTDASIVAHDGTTISSERFVLVPKRDVRAAFPHADPAVSGEGGRRLERRKVAATVLLGNLRLDGAIHIDPTKPTLGDAWESLMKDRRAFLPMTDVTLRSYSGEDRGTCPLLLVDKPDIQAALPEGAVGDQPARSDQVRARAALLLDNMRIEGTVYLVRGVGNFQRFSDRWDGLVRDYRSFVRVTDATITPIGEGAAIERPVAFVEKPWIRAVVPED